MAKRMTCSCLGFAAMIATAAAQPEAETWMPASRTAQMLTGRVTFTPTDLTFQNGKSLPLTGNGQMLFRPEPKAKKVLADLYKVTSPESMTLEGGNSLCKGKPVAYLLVWTADSAGKPVRMLAVYSGPKFTPGSPDDCGRFAYDARAH